MTNWPPLRAGTPKLSAAGPDRNVTMPSLKVSSADADPASAVAATAESSAAMRGIREKCFMISSLGFCLRLKLGHLDAPIDMAPALGEEFRRAFPARLRDRG